MSRPDISRALTILARHEALEHDLHAEARAMHAPSECHALISRRAAQRARLARRHAESEARMPLRVLRREARRRGGFTPGTIDPKWQAIVARCCRFGT